LQIPEKVKGIAFKKTGRQFIPPAREYIKDLDSLAFPAYIFPGLKNYRGQEALRQQDPCGQYCHIPRVPVFLHFFVLKPYSATVFRSRSPESVIKEWLRLRDEFGVKEIAIVDDFFYHEP